MEKYITEKVNQIKLIENELIGELYEIAYNELLAIKKILFYKGMCFFESDFSERMELKYGLPQNISSALLEKLKAENPFFVINAKCGSLFKNTKKLNTPIKYLLIETSKIAKRKGINEYDLFVNFLVKYGICESAEIAEKALKEYAVSQTIDPIMKFKIHLDFEAWAKGEKDLIPNFT